MGIMQTEPFGWQTCHALAVRTLPDAVWQWLSDKGSLTARLATLNGRRCQVVVLEQGNKPPTSEEAMLLFLSDAARPLVREVLLLGDDAAWVFARTVIPEAAMSGRLQGLQERPDRPLGDWLFSEPRVARDELEIALLSPQELGVPTHLATAHDLLWARRSKFQLESSAILVTEVFLPSFNGF